MDHYIKTVPRLENEFKEIFTNMEKITKEERSLLLMKLLHHKNEWIKAQKDKREKKFTRNMDSKNKEAGTSEQVNRPQKFPWD